MRRKIDSRHPARMSPSALIKSFNRVLSERSVYRKKAYFEMLVIVTSLICSALIAGQTPT
jgi:hypothetical protein